MTAVTVDLPEFTYRNEDDRPAWAAVTFQVEAQVGNRRVNVWLSAENDDLNIDAVEARSLAAALLAAADASEATE